MFGVETILVKEELSKIMERVKRSDNKTEHITFCEYIEYMTKRT